MTLSFISVSDSIKFDILTSVLTSLLQLPHDSRDSSDTKDLLSEAVLNSYELKDKNPEEFTSGEEQR